MGVEVALQPTPPRHPEQARRAVSKDAQAACVVRHAPCGCCSPWR